MASSMLPLQDNRLVPALYAIISFAYECDCVCIVSSRSHDFFAARNSAWRKCQTSRPVGWLRNTSYRRTGLDVVPPTFSNG